MITSHFPLSIGEEVARSERALLARMEDGEWMQSPFSVRFLVLHCSATRCNRSYTVEQMMRDHKARGFRTIGYHFYIRRDGTMTQHRRLLEVGAHARPYNRCSIGICYEGGLDELHQLFPEAEIVGHRDLPGTTPKDCPCLDAAKLFGHCLSKG